MNTYCDGLQYPNWSLRVATLTEHLPDELALPPTEHLWDGWAPASMCGMTEVLFEPFLHGLRPFIALSNVLGISADIFEQFCPRVNCKYPREIRKPVMTVGEAKWPTKVLHELKKQKWSRVLRVRGTWTEWAWPWPCACQGNKLIVITSECGPDMSWHIIVKKAIKGAWSQSCVTQKQTDVHFDLFYPNDSSMASGTGHSFPESKVSRGEGHLPVPWSGHRPVSGTHSALSSFCPTPDSGNSPRG